MAFSNFIKNATNTIAKAGIAINESHNGALRGQIYDAPQYHSNNANKALSNVMKTAVKTSQAAKNIQNNLNSAKSSSGSNGVANAAKSLQQAVAKSSGTSSAKSTPNLNAGVDNLKSQNISGTMYEDIANKNNALSIAMNRENNQFNAQQAQAQRDYETQMANTAHQREVADLKAAGLNPILSAGGTGAVTPQGASAIASNFTGTDNSIVSALAGLAANAISANATMTAASTNAAATQAAASMTAGATMAAASMSAEAQKYSSNQAYQASVYQSNKQQQNSAITQAGNVLSSIIGAYGLSKAAGIRKILK